MLRKLYEWSDMVVYRERTEQNRTREPIQGGRNKEREKRILAKKAVRSGVI